MTDKVFSLNDDLVQPFMVEKSGLNGRLIRLGASVNTILSRHDIPTPAKVLLGNMLALGAGLATALKYDGIFTIQVKGDGPVPLLVVDVTSAGDLRGYAQVKGDLPADEDALNAPVSQLLGKGHLACTVDQGPDMDRYQGVVELKGDTLEDCIDHYFEQSEQFASKVHLACGKTPEGPWRAGCIVLQRLPEQGGKNVAAAAEEDWNRAVTLMKSATEAEMLDDRLTANDLLYRLFNEDGVRVFDPKPLDVGCRCSRDKIASVLRTMPDDDVEHAMVDDNIAVTCEFCNITFDFSRDDVAELRRDA